MIYGGILAGCSIGNLASSHTLDWFFIALAAVLMAASLTLAPALAALDPRTENYKLPLAFGSFTFFLEILLLVCCIYTGGDWFLTAETAVLFGFALVFLPFLLPTLPLPYSMADKKTSIYLLTVTGLLILLLLVCCVYAGDTWFPVAAVSVIFGLSLFIMPVLLYQLPLSQWMAERKLSMYLLIETGLLLLLLLVCDITSGGGWFFTAALGVLLGLGVVFLPIILRQTLRGLPLCRHKALLYLLAETVFLLLLLFVTALQGGLRASCVSAWMGIWLWLAPAVFEQIMIPVYGEPDKPYALAIPFDLSRWDLPYRAWNVIMLILLALGAVTIFCVYMGLRAERKRRKQ